MWPVKRGNFAVAGGADDYGGYADIWVASCAATDLFKMLNKYRPESKEAKEERRKQTAEKGAAVAKSKDQSVKCGINQIARLVESKKATMVLIAHDVS
jgi:hypothetical protein